MKEPIIETAESIGVSGKAMIRGSSMRIPFWMSTIVVWLGVISGAIRTWVGEMLGSCFVQTTT